MLSMVEGEEDVLMINSEGTKIIISMGATALAASAAATLGAMTLF